MTGSTKPKQRRNRQATEAAILDAFERVITRDGVAAANPTSIMTEAGFSKPLLYDYFGNMAGLAAAWAERESIWPNYDFPSGDDDTDFQVHLKRFLIATADKLRSSPVTLELLTAELGCPPEWLEVLEDSRRKWLQENMRDVLLHPEIREPGNWNMMFVLYSAINYLALRSRRESPHAGMRLDTDAGWNDAMDRVEKIADDLMLLARIKRIIRNGQADILSQLLDTLETSVPDPESPGAPGELSS